MELPECYFPVRLCQHNEESGRRRRAFAEYGSYSQVDVYPPVDGEPLVTKFRPQKGLGIVKGLCKNLPPLPLYDQPISENRVIHDHILGVDNYNDVMCGLPLFFHGTARAKTDLVLSKNDMDKKIDYSQKLVHDYLEKPSNTSECLEKVKQKLPFWLNCVVKYYTKASAAFNDDCLMGFNRDFYQGLLCHKQSSSSTTLFHAAGDRFKEIYMTEVSQDENSLPRARQLSKLTMKKPVFQLKCSEKGVLCARQKKECVVMTYNEARHCLDISTSTSLGKTLSDVALSPYNSDEILLCAKAEVVLWNIQTSCQTLLHKVKEPKCEQKTKWTSSHFAGHPRQIVVADSTSMLMFDHRDHFKKGVELFCLSHSYVKDYERVMAMDFLGFPNHLVATDHTLFLMDQRFPGTPVLQWSSESMTAPQLLKSCQLSEMKNSHMTGESHWWIFSGTQQPAEVVCHSLCLAKASAPVTKTLPWQVGKLGDLIGNQHTSYQCQRLDMDKCFQSSLAGLTVVDQTVHQQEMLSVYQMDGYGDIFFQNYKLSKHLVDPGCYSVVPPSVDEKFAADQRATHFLSALDRSEVEQRASNYVLSASETTHYSQSEDSCSSEDSSSIHNRGEGSALKYHEIESLFSGSCEASSSKKEEKTGLTYAEFQRKVCPHKPFFPMHKLETTSANTRLLLALKNGADIQEVLEERENDHLRKRLVLRERYQKKKAFHCPMPHVKRRRINKSKERGQESDVKEEEKRQESEEEEDEEI